MTQTVPFINTFSINYSKMFKIKEYYLPMFNWWLELQVKITDGALAHQLAKTKQMDIDRKMLKHNNIKR